MTAAEEQWASELQAARAEGYRMGQEDMRERARKAITKHSANAPYAPVFYNAAITAAELAIAELEILPLPAKESA